jgi:hypothetical protein
MRVDKPNRAARRKRVHKHPKTVGVSGRVNSYAGMQLDLKVVPRSKHGG